MAPLPGGGGGGGGQDKRLDTGFQLLHDGFVLPAHNRLFVFSQFTSMLSLIAEALGQTGIPYFYLAGQTKAADRKRYVICRSLVRADKICILSVPLSMPLLSCISS